MFCYEHSDCNVMSNIANSILFYELLNNIEKLEISYDITIFDTTYDFTYKVKTVKT